MDKTLESNPLNPLADIHRGAGWVIGCLLTLAFATLGLWLEQMPTFRVEPLDVLPAVITLQVIGAVVLAAWLIWSPA